MDFRRFEWTKSHEIWTGCSLGPCDYLNMSLDLYDHLRLSYGPLKRVVASKRIFWILEELADANWIKLGTYTP